jgi:bifunctional non-homologous end joining protein LigD
MPKWVEPMKGTLVDAPFDRRGWIFEDKYDGIRSLAYISNKKYLLFSRNEKEMAMRYPELKDLPKWLTAKQAIIDGEIIVVNKHGHASFQELQARFGVTRSDAIERLVKVQKIVYIVFDLLYFDGYSLLDVKLIDRKKVLAKIVKENKLFQVAPHTENEGLKRFKQAEKLQLEGIMAKDASSRYQQKRSREWLKMKTSRRQEAVIVGYTRPRGSREYFGALLLGLYDRGKLISAGKVGTGFSEKTLHEIYKKMQPLKTDKAPFPAPRPGTKSRWGAVNTEVQWIKPKLVCEVRFTEMTNDNNFRHPAFMGLRFDKKPQQCTLEEQESALKAVRKAEKEK